MTRADPDTPRPGPDASGGGCTSVYLRLVRMHHDHTLFTCPHHNEELLRTTNKLEGGINADLKRKLDATVA